MSEGVSLFVLHPLALMQRTGIHLKIGESVRISGLSLVGGADVAPASDGYPGGNRSCRGSRFTVYLGSQREHVEQSPVALIARSDGELVLSAYDIRMDGSGFCLPSPETPGLAWVLVER